MSSPDSKRLSPWRAYLQLVRFPAVFTAFADVLLGFLLNHERLSPGGHLAALLGASACLYLSGMVWNDVFDRTVDAVERPERPLPSGRVRLEAAIALGTGLMVAGVAAAAWVGRPSLAVAVAIVVAVFAYDGFLKRTPVGPLGMGACRFLNVMLGASAVEAYVWAQPQILVAGALGIYVAGITWFSRSEAVRSQRLALGLAALVVNGGLAGLFALVLTHPWRGGPNIAVVAALLAAIVCWIDARIVQAVADPQPRKVQTAVRTMIFALVLLDAVMVLAQTWEPAYAGLTAALLVPGLIVGRWLSVT